MLPPAAAEGVEPPERDDGTTREAVLRARPQSGSAAGDDETASQWGEVVGTDESRRGHLESARPSRARPPTITERLADLFYQQHSDLSDDQIKCATAEAAPLLGMLDEAKTTPQRISEVVALFAQHQREKQAAGQSGGPGPSAPTLADVEATQRLSDFLRKQVEVLRAELFGSTRPPFGTLAEAVTWLREEATQHARGFDDALASDEALQSFRERTPDLRIIAEPRIVYLGDPRLETLGEGEDDFSHLARASLMAAQLSEMPGRVALHPAGSSELLARLADVQRQLAEQVGVHELGRHPLCPAWHPTGRTALAGQIRATRSRHRGTDDNAVVYR